MVNRHRPGSGEGEAAGLRFDAHAAAGAEAIHFLEQKLRNGKVGLPPRGSGA